jgi:hypothetical protein
MVTILVVLGLLILVPVVVGVVDHFFGPENLGPDIDQLMKDERYDLD